MQMRIKYHPASDGPDAKTPDDFVTVDFHEAQASTFYWLMTDGPIPPRSAYWARVILKLREATGGFRYRNQTR